MSRHVSAHCQGKVIWVLRLCFQLSGWHFLLDVHGKVTPASWNQRFPINPTLWIETGRDG